MYMHICRVRRVLLGGSPARDKDHYTKTMREEYVHQEGGTCKDSSLQKGCPTNKAQKGHAKMGPAQKATPAKMDTSAKREELNQDTELPAKTQKTENSNLRGFEVHRPSSKGTKLLLQVIKAIINQLMPPSKRKGPRVLKTQVSMRSSQRRQLLQRE